MQTGRLFLIVLFLQSVLSGPVSLNAPKRQDSQVESVTLKGQRGWQQSSHSEKTNWQDNENLSRRGDRPDARTTQIGKIVERREASEGLEHSKIEATQAIEEHQPTETTINQVETSDTKESEDAGPITTEGIVAKTAAEHEVAMATTEGSVARMTTQEIAAKITTEASVAEITKGQSVAEIPTEQSAAEITTERSVAKEGTSQTALIWSMSTSKVVISGDDERRLYHIAMFVSLVLAMFWAIIFTLTFFGVIK